MQRTKYNILPSFKNKEGLLSDEDYKKYNDEKEKIIQECGDDWKLKHKRILELALEPNGHYQRFIWNHVPEFERVKQERRAKGKVKTRHYD